MININAHLENKYGKWISYFYLVEEQYIVSFFNDRIKILKTKSSNAKLMINEIFYKDISYVTLNIQSFDKIELTGIKNKIYAINLKVFGEAQEYNINIFEIQHLKYIFNILDNNGILIKNKENIEKLIELTKEDLIYYFKKINFNKEKL